VALDGALNGASSSVSRSSVPARCLRSITDVRRPVRDDCVGVVFSGGLNLGLGRALVASKLLRLASNLLSARLGLCFVLLNASLDARSGRGEGSESSTWI
jgi:hypothetical protein